MKFKKETSAGGIVYKKIDSQLLWLITQNSYNKRWGLPKGLIGDKDSEEKKEEAALREVEEEGGVKAKIISKDPAEVKYKYRFQDYLIDKTVFYFLMEYISGDTKDHDWEMMDAKFVTEEEVKKTLSFKSDKEAFAKALELFKVYTG